MIRIIDGANAQVVAAARERLSIQRPYAHYFRDVELQFAEGVLILRGRVSTDDLKQTLQLRLLELPEVLELRNCVEVVSSRGVSSPPQSHCLDG